MNLTFNTKILYRNIVNLYTGPSSGFRSRGTNNHKGDTYFK